ncbi:MAG: tetratricopeptide repeat protein [Bacteroidales bacterium]|nr:tetratricopeptide repeat protein [Candidatus Latescibacterota bacterium]
MSSFLNAILVETPWAALLRFLIDVTIKSGLIIGVASIATLLLRRNSAYIRNMVWGFALAGLLLMPVLSFMAPVWNLPIIPEPGSWGTTSYTPEYTKLDQDSLVGPPFHDKSASLSAADEAGLSSPMNIPWYAWCIFTWLAGGIICLGYCVISHVGVRHIVRNAHPVKKRWRSVLNHVSMGLDVEREVGLLESDRVRTAITAGVFEPVVIVPAESRDWTPERMSLVLSHELAHVKRWDTLVEVFALLATVVYWFNPMVWFAVKQLRIERERDCDDAVLCTGARPSDYAELLLKIAADLGDSARPVWQLSTISQGSNLKDRLMSILNPRIDRKRGGRRSVLITGIIVLAIVLPLSASGLWNDSMAQDKQEKEKKAQIEQMKKKDIEKKMQEKKKQKALKKKMSAEEMKKLTPEEKKKMEAKKALKNWESLMENENSAAAVVAKTFKKKGVKAGLKKFQMMKEADSHYIDEKEFNTLGYTFLTWGKHDEAIAAFKINVKEFPDSWNVYDSLGEAYMSADKYDKAVKNYKMALKLNPDSKSSQFALQKLSNMAKKEK